MAFGKLREFLQSFFTGFFAVDGDDKLTFCNTDVGSLDVVGRNAMTPPQLSADAPVLNVLQPVLISVLVFCRIEFNLVVHHWRQGDVGKVFHLEEPLQRKSRLNGCIWIALRISHLVDIFLNTFHQACGLEVFYNLLAAVEAVHADIERRGFGYCAVGIEDVDGFQIVSLTQHVVVGVMCRSNLQTTCTKFNLHISVFNDPDLSAHKRYNDTLAFQPLVLWVFRVDTHRSIAHDSLGTGGGDDCIETFFVFMDYVAIFCGKRLGVDLLTRSEIVFQVIELRLFFSVDNLFGRESRQCLRIPVHHPQATVYESFFVKVDKDFNDSFASLLIHGECRTVPVARGTQTTKLFQDDTSMLMSPVPCMV